MFQKQNQYFLFATVQSIGCTSIKKKKVVVCFNAHGSDLVFSIMEKILVLLLLYLSRAYASVKLFTTVCSLQPTGTCIAEEDRLSSLHMLQMDQVPC